MNFGIFDPELDLNVGPGLSWRFPAGLRASTTKVEASIPTVCAATAFSTPSSSIRPSSTLLDRHPEAAVCAIGPDGLMVEMPGSVPLAGHRVVRDRSTLNLVTAGDRGVVINAWERARAVGASRVLVRLASDASRPVVLYLIDGRRSHGVYLGVVVDAVGDDAAVFDPETPSVAPRFVRSGKSVRRGERGVGAVTRAGAGPAGRDRSGRRGPGRRHGPGGVRQSTGPRHLGLSPGDHPRRSVVHGRGARPVRGPEGLRRGTARRRRRRHRRDRSAGRGRRKRRRLPRQRPPRRRSRDVGPWVQVESAGPQR